jgi:hypothetical protein
MFIGIGDYEGNLETSLSFSRYSRCLFACTYFNPRVESWLPSFVEIIFCFEHNSVHTALSEEFIARKEIRTTPICICHSTCRI